MKWTLIRNALGNWEIEDLFLSKEAALRYAGSFEDDGKPRAKRYGSSTFYHYGSWGIVKTVNLERHGYELPKNTI